MEGRANRITDEEPGRLGVGEAAAVCVVSYLVYVAASLLLYNVLPLKAGAAISSALLIGTAYYLIWRTMGRPGVYVRLRGLGPGILLCSVLASLAIIPLAASVMATLVSRFDLPEEWLESAYELVRADDLQGLLYAWLTAALLAALGEEFVFRGVLQNSLASRFPPWVAILIASGVFAVLHVWRFPAAFVLGAFLGTLYAITGSLLAPIVAHLTINTVVVVGSFALERAEPESLPNWIAQDTAAPAGLLGASIAVFALLMLLIRKAAAAAPPGSDYDAHPGPEASL